VNFSGEIVKALNRKLWRDLWRMKGQVFAITLVVMSGVATFIMFISTVNSLNFTRNKFYRDYNFADVFVNLKRSPESLKDKIKNWRLALPPMPSWTSEDLPNRLPAR
jgi:putative ABC transport system permease protein